MTPPERIWLLRHAETTAPHVFNGSESDVPLSELGFRQAELLGGWFVAKRPTAVVSSTMIRAVQTALPIARQCGAPHSQEHLFRERSIGLLSGQAFHPTLGPWAETVREWSDPMAELLELGGLSPQRIGLHPRVALGTNSPVSC